MIGVLTGAEVGFFSMRKHLSESSSHDKLSLLIPSAVSLALIFLMFGADPSVLVAEIHTGNLPSVVSKSLARIDVGSISSVMVFRLFPSGPHWNAFHII